MGLKNIMTLPEGMQPVVRDPQQQVLQALLDCKSEGIVWQRDYELPGRKLLMEILAKVYEQFVTVEAMDDASRDKLYDWLRRYLRGQGVKLHADAPAAGIMLRVVFPTLDATRVSRYARAIHAAHSWRKPADKFVEFVKESGGIAKVEHAPILAVVPAKPAKAAVPETAKVVVPHLDQQAAAPEEDFGEDEIDEDELEYGDELFAYLESKRAAPMLSVPDPGLDASQGRVILVGEVINGQLHVYEQVPFHEQAVAQAFRLRYATADLLRDAINPAVVPVDHTEVRDEEAN